MDCYLQPSLLCIFISWYSYSQSSGLGCKYNDTYIGCLCYADDIILISHSVTVMQNLLVLCDVFSAKFDVRFNTTKSVAMRIGPRYDAVCADLTLSGGIIQYVQSLKYLGVCILYKQIERLYVILTMSKPNSIGPLTVFMLKVLQETQN